MNTQAALHGRLLLLADADATAPLRSLLAAKPFAGWDVIEVENCEHARFLQQFDAFDVVLIDHMQLAGAGRAALACLASPNNQTPLVVLADTGPQVDPPQAGQEHRLSRRLVLEHPAVLEVVLRQAVQLSALHQQLRRREQALQSCRRQVNSLVNLLWQSVPTEELAGWLTQRTLLERLGEEVARSQRYGAPLSVVVGELADRSAQLLDPREPGELATWTARRVSHTKRRCDVAGQYGPHGFLLLLPQTGDAAASNFCRRLLPALESTEGLPDGVLTAPRFRCATASLSSSTATAQGLLSQAEERLEHAR